MGPESAKSYPGQQMVPAADETHPAARAKQEIDYGRRGKGYVFGAFTPDNGQALTETYGRRTIANYIDFLEKVDRWLPADKFVYGIVDNSVNASGNRCPVVHGGAPTLGVCLPAQVRCLPESDRTLVEDLAFARPEGPPLRDVGRSLPGHQGGDGLLECTPSSLCLGTTATPLSTAQARCWSSS